MLAPCELCDPLCSALFLPDQSEAHITAKQTLSTNARSVLSSRESAWPNQAATFSLSQGGCSACLAAAKQRHHAARVFKGCGWSHLRAAGEHLAHALLAPRSTQQQQNTAAAGLPCLSAAQPLRVRLLLLFHCWCGCCLNQVVAATAIMVVTALKLHHVDIQVCVCVPCHSAGAPERR